MADRYQKESHAAYIEKFKQPEKHFQPECRFQTLGKCRLIKNNQPKTIYVLIRICKCGKFTDHSHLMDKKNFTPDDFTDGIEMHFHPNCRYEIHRFPAKREDEDQEEVEDRVDNEDQELDEDQEKVEDQEDNEDQEQDENTVEDKYSHHTLTLLGYCPLDKQ